MVFCVSWQFFRNFSSHSTRQDLKYLFCLLHKSTLDLRSFFFFSSENLSALADTFVTWWWWQNYHLFCLLSLQKPEVKSYGALSREVQKQAWLWKWGTGWLDKQAENLPTAAWTATAQKESEWCWQSGGLLHASLESSFSPPLCVSINANSHALWHWFNFHWLICCEENFCLPATGKCDLPGFLYQWK